jgi:hypothetical protein
MMGGLERILEIGDILGDGCHFRKWVGRRSLVGNRGRLVAKKGNGWL